MLRAGGGVACLELLRGECVERVLLVGRGGARVVGALLLRRQILLL